MGVSPIAFTLQSASPYSLCYAMVSAGAVTTILPQATLLADARSAFVTYPNVSGLPLVETLLTPVADDGEANSLMSIGNPAAGPSNVQVLHCWLNITPIGGNQQWAVLGTRDAVSGLAEITVVSGGVGNAYLWIRRTHTLDQ